MVGPEYTLPEVAEAGQRVLAGTLAFDPESGIPSNIVADSVSLYRKPFEEKQNFLRIVNGEYLTIHNKNQEY